MHFLFIELPFRNWTNIFEYAMLVIDKSRTNEKALDMTTNKKTFYKRLAMYDVTD